MDAQQKKEEELISWVQFYKMNKQDNSYAHAKMQLTIMRNELGIKK